MGGAHYNYINVLGLDGIHVTAQIQGKHESVSITGAYGTQTEH